MDPGSLASRRHPRPRRSLASGRLAVPLLIALLGLALLLGGPLTAQPAGGVAYSIELSGTVDPATERWLGQALEDAEAEGAQIAIVRLDTPGGLDTSMRSMVKDIVAAPLPVVVFVAPNGARAASAGMFVTQAADVAAMAPQTNVGSATPVQIGPGEEDEVLAARCETTPPPTSARWRRVTGATRTWPSAWSARRRM